MTDDMQRAREQFEAWCNGRYNLATCQNQLDNDVYVDRWVQGAWVGFRAALRAAPEGFGSVSPVDHVRYWAEAYGSRASGPHFQGHGKVHALLTEYADLLERLAGRPQGVKDRPPIDGCTESNCKRCRTHPDHRGGMEHAGIGWRPDSPQNASDG